MAEFWLSRNKKMSIFNYIQANYSAWTWGSAILLIMLFTQTILIYLLNKILPHKKMLKDNEIILEIFCISGTIYAILYGFLTFFVLNNYQSDVQSVTAEVNAIGNICRNISLSQDKKMYTIIKKDFIEYLDVVIKKEWPIQKQGVNTDIHIEFLNEGWVIIEKIAKKIVSIPLNPIIKEKALDDLNDLYDARSIRIHNSQLQMPDVVWVITVLSALFILTNVAIIGCSQLKIKIISAYLLTGSIGLMIILLAYINKPFIHSSVFTKTIYKDIQRDLIT